MPLLWDAADCVRHPIVLSFNQGRFLPLVGTSDRSYTDSAVDFVPLVTSQLEPLRVWFLLDSEECIANELTQRYMKMSEVGYTNTHSVSMIPGAQLKYENLPRDVVPAGLSVVQGVRSEAVAEVHEGSAQQFDPTAPSVRVLPLERTGGHGNHFRGM